MSAKSSSKTKQKINRIYHTWDKWECYPAGFYETGHDTLSDEEAKTEYAKFLRDLVQFEKSLVSVLGHWKNSCEHYLTNERMNRVAWLGQASACIALNLPSKYRSGYFLLTEEERCAADNLALEYLNKWLTERGYNTVDLEGAGIKTEVNLY